MSAPSVTQAADPALPNRTNPIRKMTADEARTATTSMLVIAAMLLVGTWSEISPPPAIGGGLGAVCSAATWSMTLVHSLP